MPSTTQEPEEAQVHQMVARRMASKRRAEPRAGKVTKILKQHRLRFLPMKSWLNLARSRAVCSELGRFRRAYQTAFSSARSRAATFTVNEPEHFGQVAHFFGTASFASEVEHMGSGLGVAPERLLPRFSQPL